MKLPELKRKKKGGEEAGAPGGGGPKVPTAISDIGKDLSDMHLVPVVILLVVAIVAVPLLMGKSDPKLSPTTGLTGIPAPSGDVSDATAQMVVVADAPGLRDYTRRLSHLKATDPFNQKFSITAVSDDASGEPTGSATGTGDTGLPASTSTDPVPAPVVPDTPSSNGGTSSGSDNGPTQIHTETRYISYEINMRVVHPPAKGSKAKAKTQVRHGLPVLTMLPSRKAPIAIYMGVSSDRKKALLLLSSDVNSIYGDARCVLGSKTCQLLALEPGVPETFVYGAKNKTVRMQLLAINRVVRDKPRAAPFAAPDQGKEGKIAPAPASLGITLDGAVPAG